MDAITIAQFRRDFPAFGDQNLFPDDQVAFWAMVAASMLNPSRFRSALSLCMELFIAHNVAIEAAAQLGADLGGIPGLARGVISGESGGGVSASYDTSSTTDPKAGHWNYTIYGQRLVRYINMAGMGPIYVGAGFFPTAAFLYGLPLPAFCGPGWRQDAETPALGVGSIAAALGPGTPGV